MALVVLLKGVNVGGHRTFRPSALAKALRRFDVVNIGAAGTFVIRKTASSGSDILRWTTADPFAGEPSGPNIVRFVTVLAKRGRLSPQVPLSLPSGGEWCLRILAHEDRFVFGVYRREMRAIKYLGQLEKVFGVSVTTRNWNTMLTVAKLLRLSAG
jgi:hypothetical protein